MKPQAAKNLPRIASKGETGSVIRSSMVPVLRSSAHSRMATAGTRSKIEPGVIVRRTGRDRLGLIEETADVEGERTGQRNKDRQEDNRERRCEVSAEFALGYDPDVSKVSRIGRASRSIRASGRRKL